MNNEIERIKYFRRRILQLFFILFIPNITVTIISVLVTSNPMAVVLAQSFFFATYFMILVIIYAFAPKIINRQISKP